MVQTTIQKGFNPQNSTTIIQCNLEDLQALLREQWEIARKQAEEDTRNRGLSEHLTTEEVKNLLHISTPTLWRYSRQNLVDSVFIGGKKYYTRESVNALINNGK